MKVREIMSQDVRTVRPDQTVKDAARVMVELDTGCLPVAQDDRLVGMVTDRDIAVRAVARGYGPDCRIEEIMSSGVKYCYDDEDTDDICRNLADLQVRRMPVVNRDKRLVGILSLGDIALKNADGYAGAALTEISRPNPEGARI